MTRKKSLPPVTESILREEESLRLHYALGNVEPGSDAYSKILGQITALNAHVRNVQIENVKHVHNVDIEEAKHTTAVQTEDLKQQAAIRIERQKADAAYKQKQVDFVAKIVVVSAILIFESSGHAIITKAFGLIRD